MDFYSLSLCDNLKIRHDKSDSIDNVSLYLLSAVCCVYGRSLDRKQIFYTHVDAEQYYVVHIWF